MFVKRMSTSLYLPNHDFLPIKTICKIVNEGIGIIRCVNGLTVTCRQNLHAEGHRPMPLGLPSKHTTYSQRCNLVQFSFWERNFVDMFVHFRNVINSFWLTFVQCFDDNFSGSFSFGFFNTLAKRFQNVGVLVKIFGCAVCRKLRFYNIQTYRQNYVLVTIAKNLSEHSYNHLTMSSNELGQYTTVRILSLTLLELWFQGTLIPQCGPICSDGGLETWFYGSRSRLGLISQRSRFCLGLEV